MTGVPNVGYGDARRRGEKLENAYNNSFSSRDGVLHGLDTVFLLLDIKNRIKRGEEGGAQTNSHQVQHNSA